MSKHNHEGHHHGSLERASERPVAEAMPAARRLAYFDCFAGISGDMTLGALIAAGADEGELRRGLQTLGLPGWELRTRRVQRNAITATDIEVLEKHEHQHQHEHNHGREHEHKDGSEHEHEPNLQPPTPNTQHPTPNTGHGRHLAEILAMIRQSGLPQPVKERASAAFQRLGEAEAKIHDVPVEAIHFHEVGAVDSIIDIVGSVFALYLLGVERIVCSPLPAGHGFVKAAHGLMPIPAPATMELLKGVPTRSVDVEGELVTPTGATLMKTLADEFGWMPAMRVEAIGYGAGKKEFPFPNLLRVCVGREVSRG